MMRIVRRTLELANLPPLSDEMLEERAKVWAETLFEVVPEKRLGDAFKKAVADHNTTFAVSAYDMKIAFQKISTDENAAYLRAREKDLADLDRMNLTANYPECENCLNTGWKWIKQSEPSGRIHLGVIRCETCNYWWNVREKLASRTTDKLPGRHERSYQE